MSKHRRLSRRVFLSGTLGSLSLLILSPAGLAAAGAAPISKPSALQRYLRMPLSFERNLGQTDPRASFLAHGRESTLFLTPTEAVFVMPTGGQSHSGKSRSLASPMPMTALRMQLVEANRKALPVADGLQSGRVNYFLDKDPRRWHTDVPTYGQARFQQVYPGVDLVYYGNQQQLEYDFVVAPHADPGRIALHFAGADRVHIDGQGNLAVTTNGRTLTWHKPTIYQQGEQGRKSVSGRFRLRHLPGGQTQVRFALGRYDANRALVIDPVLNYSTYIGGTSTGADTATGIAVDSDGNAYIAGSASSNDFPTTSGAYQPTKTKADIAGFITKFNPNGSALIYSTYLGGNASDSITGLAIDVNGGAYVTGRTTSSDFPVTPGAFQTTNKGTGITGFVTKLNATGSALSYSTYLGGSSGNPNNSGEWPQAIAVDGGGNAYVTGLTASNDFPVTTGAAQTVFKGQNDAFVTKLNPTGAGLVYSTYLGGVGNDYGYAITVDGSGAAYVGGQTASTDFPITPGAFNPTKGAGQFTANSFVTKVDPSGSTFVYSTYLKETNEGSAHGIAVDTTGHAYVVGFSTSTDFPTTPGAFQTVNRAPSGTKCAYLIRLDPTGTAALYSTYLGGDNYSTATGVVVDRSDKATVVGFEGCTDFPTTVGAYGRVPGGGTATGNVYVTKFNPAGDGLVYSTLIPADNHSFGNAIALDSAGNAYVTGETFSKHFPVTSNAFQKTNRSSGFTNSFVTKLSLNPIFPDFNNNGKTDLVIQNASTGQIASWFMNGGQWTGGAFFSQTPPTEYALVGTGDFSGNGATTLLLQSRNDGRLAFWYTGGTDLATITGGAFLSHKPGSDWTVAGVGDFNGDGKSDILFRNTATGQIAVWYMNGTTYLGGTVLNSKPAAGWTLVGCGDFNADGFTDLVFQNQGTGQITVWYLHGTTFLGGEMVNTTPASGYKVVGVGDYNGDGYADLLFESAGGSQASVWYLRGGTFLSGDPLSLNLPGGWQIVAPR